RLNTPGSNNGEVKVWVDGNVVADWTDLVIRKIDTLKLDETYIGLHALHSERLNKKWYDNVVIATQYIGPMASPSPSPSPTPTSTPTPTPTPSPPPTSYPGPSSHGDPHSPADRTATFTTGRDGYADAVAKEGTREGPWEGPSASFAYAYANSLITSSTSTPTRIAIRTQGSSTV